MNNPHTDRSLEGSNLPQFASDAILRDGGSIRIRAIRPDDKEALLAHFSALSDRSRYLRFFSSKTRLTPAELTRLTEVDFVRNVGLVATLGSGDEERVIGDGRYAAVDDAEEHPTRVAVAFAVLDEHQGRGVGTILLEHLARIAHANGVRVIEADTLGDNRKMLALFARSGFSLEHSREDGVAHVSFATDETAAFRATKRRRERLAAAQSVRRLMEPSSVAVIGSSDRPESTQELLVTNLIEGGFPGPIYPVNQSVQTVAGLLCTPSIEAIGKPVDLAVVAVPAGQVETVVHSAVRSGSRAVVVISSSGFAESSGGGRRLQRTVRQVARSGGLRLVGPASFGIMNTDPDLRLNAILASEYPMAGNIGLLSQGGEQGLRILDAARSQGIGCSSFVSLGNRADVSENDFLSFWVDDRRTDVIVLNINSLGDPRKFSWIAPEVSRRKPIVVFHAASNAGEGPAAVSNLAAVTQSDVAMEALFEQAGVIQVETVNGLLDLLTLLSLQPVPEGLGVGVVTNDSELGVLLADACDASGLGVPCFDSIPGPDEAGSSEASLGNPIQVLDSADSAAYEAAMTELGNAPEINAIITIHLSPNAGDPVDVADRIARAAGMVPPHKPVIAVFPTSSPSAALHEGPRGRLPYFSEVETTVAVLAAAARYGCWRRYSSHGPVSLGEEAGARIRELVDGELANGNMKERWLSVEIVERLLAAAGIRTVPAVTVAVADAPKAAGVLGFPLLAKAVTSDPVPSTEFIEDVLTGLESIEDVGEACSELEARLQGHGLELHAVRLQRQVKGSAEALVGMAHDPVFGPLIVCGVGRTMLDAVSDVRFRLTPVSDIDAATMMDGPGRRGFLEGFRGAPPVDRAALEEIVLRVSALVEVAPEIIELDLDPVKVLRRGDGAVVVNARIRIASTEIADD